MIEIKPTKWQRINTEFLGTPISGFGLVVNGTVWAVNEWGGKCAEIGGLSPEMLLQMLLRELEKDKRNNFFERLARNGKIEIEKEFGSPYLN